MKIIILRFLFFVFIQSQNNEQYCASLRQNSRFGNECKICYDSYIQYDGTCRPVTNRIQNCLQYLNESECAICQLGFALSNQSQCIPIQQENCDKLSFDGRCILCSRGILNLNNNCNLRDRCTLQNCDFCVYAYGLEQCSRCQQGYSIQNKDQKGNICVKNNQNQENCIFQRLDGSCDICDLNFYQSRNGRCVRNNVTNLILSEKYIQQQAPNVVEIRPTQQSNNSNVRVIIENERENQTVQIPQENVISQAEDVVITIPSEAIISTPDNSIIIQETNNTQQNQQQQEQVFQNESNSNQNQQPDIIIERPQNITIEQDPSQIQDLRIESQNQNLNQNTF